MLRDFNFPGSEVYRDGDYNPEMKSSFATWDKDHASLRQNADVRFHCQRRPRFSKLGVLASPSTVLKEMTKSGSIATSTSS